MADGNQPKKRLSQTDVPGYPLEQAIRVAEAISENYAGAPTKPLHVANALGMAPQSSHFRQLCGAAIAYGITDGGYNAGEISLTELGRRIVRPLKEGDDANAMREAFLTPRIIREFLTKYNGSPFPPAEIARNVLVAMGVPDAKAAETFAMIVEGARSTNLVQEIKGKLYGDLDAKPGPGRVSKDAVPHDDFMSSGDDELEPDVADQTKADSGASLPPSDLTSQKVIDNRKVFITHGKDKSFVEPIKKLLSFGELTPVVSVEKQSTSVPVPEKVLQEMRSCSAAIIHVGDSEAIKREDGSEDVWINPNVLIEIGVALALYNRRFILLVQNGVKLPSNLQGLYEVRYDGPGLDGDATIRLLEAINEMKKQKSPH